MAEKVKDRKPLLEAMGLEMVSITKRAFTDESLRAAAWPPRKSGGDHSLLRKSGALWQSIRISGITNNEVTVSSDRIYAAIQQLGSRKEKGRGSGIPPRPFFPFDKSGNMTPKARALIESVLKVAIERKLLKG